MNFNFFTAGKLIFGSGNLDQLGDEAKKLGSNYLVVCGGKSMESTGVLNKIEHQLQEKGLEFSYYKGVVEEPEPETVEKGVKIALQNGCNAVIAIGGGSVIDTGKAVSALITNSGSLVDYLEGVGKGLVLENDPAPCIAIPTTSGTGSEVTKNAVITSIAQRFKKSLRHDKLIPDVALVDPQLTLSLPPQQTAWSGMDALTQLIESYVTKKANPMTDALSMSGIALMGKSLKRAFENGDDLTAREDVAMASLLSGICLANSGLGAAHGFAAGLGCFYGVPHGLACSILLPHVMELNMEYRLKKFSEIGKILTKKEYATDSEAAEAGIIFIIGLNNIMGIPKDLKELNIQAEDIPSLINASKGNSMSGNPVLLDDSGMAKFLTRLL